MKPFVFLIFFAAFSVLASLPEAKIPREATKHFLEEGVFGGGSSLPANLEGIRFSPHKSAGFERWVVDFSDEKSRTVGKIAPRFQIRYVKPTQIEAADGTSIHLVSGKLVLTIQKAHSFLNPLEIKKLVRKSSLVKEIVLYPPIENNDLAIEFVLKDHVLFEPHQPSEREGRLVLDIKRKSK